ncbi:hypothetical protein EV191_10673 [Tamaricihabitans halophyticus]|uniref:Uncharacterized protein n=1 Tax=Tamaricihabitans halophyticus TaxID=1262583 RepID=A0A4R2QSG6_9PSEU|nr:hypothetical protein EV191_10673 [Tamaricihabitans halophyticus]
MLDCLYREATLVTSLGATLLRSAVESACIMHLVEPSGGRVVDLRIKLMCTLGDQLVLLRDDD